MKNSSDGMFAQIRPKLLERSCGGWLAVSEPWASLKIGVAAATEQEAMRRFEIELAVWGKLFEQSPA